MFSRRPLDSRILLLHSIPRLRGKTAALALVVGTACAFHLTTVHCEPPKALAPLIAAVSKGDLQTVKAILEPLSPVDREKLVNTRQPGGWAALHVAVGNNREDVLAYLLAEGAEIDITDNYNYNGDIDPAIVASRREINPNFNPRAACFGWTALHYATAFGNVGCVRILLEQGANIAAPDSFRRTPEQYISIFHAGKSVESTLRGMYAEAKKHNSKWVMERKRAARIKFPLEEKLRKMMVGQIMPILTVSAALRRRDNGWVDEDKPLVFLFLGSSGVGKTMLAKAIASNLGSDQHSSFIRIDMSEYGHKHEVSKLIGAPPGYVGFEQGGQLTTALAKCPDAVVLLDEVEKAHPEVLTLMLQVFDEGRLTDGQGKTIHCPNAVFIMTSNLLQDQIRAHVENGKLRPKLESEAVALDTTSLQTATMLRVTEHTNTFMREVAQPVLKHHFKRDEFLGRINEMVVFHPFDKGDLAEIVKMELSQWASRAAERHNITISWTDAVVARLAKGYNEAYGFRSIKYEVQKQVVNLLAYAHERDVISSGCKLTLDIDKQEDAESLVLKDIVQTGPPSSGQPSKNKGGGLGGYISKLWEPTHR